MHVTVVLLWNYNTALRATEGKYITAVKLYFKGNSLGSAADEASLMES